MIIQSFHISKDTELRKYLREAEAYVDTLDEEKLALAELQVEGVILQLIARDKSTSLLSWRKVQARNKSKKSKFFPWSLPPIVIAAAAIFVLPNVLEENSQTAPTSQVKGFGSPDLQHCSVQALQSGKGSLEFRDKGFQADRGAIYIKSDCTGELRLQVNEGGVWKELETLENADGLLKKAGEIYDFSPLVNKSLRLVGEDGVSEEFQLLLVKL